jgi:hypothetical protein
MLTHRFRTAAVCAAALTALLFCAPPPARAQSNVESRLTVGIFSRSFLVQTFYRSNVWKKKMQDLMSARNEAAVASDSLKVDRIDRELANMQSLAQRQLTGDAPLTNIYDALKNDWPAIATEAKVDIIVEPPVYLTPGATLVDVTPVMVKHLGKRD